MLEALLAPVSFTRALVIVCPETDWGIEVKAVHASRPSLSGVGHLELCASCLKRARRPCHL